MRQTCQTFVLILAFTISGFAAAQERADLRVIVLIPEEVIMRPVPDPAAETEISRALINAGFRLVDLAQSERLEQREAIKTGLAPDHLANLRERFNADVLITGEAFSEEDTVIGGVSFFQSRLEVKAVDLSNGQIFFSDAYTAPGRNVAPSVAAKDALQNAGAEAGEVLPGKLDEWLVVGSATGRTFILRLTAIPGFGAYNDVLERLRGQAGIEDVTSRQFDTAGSEAEVSFNGSVEELAVLIESLGLTVTGLSGGEVRAEFPQ